mmetsp:Transcript_131703/g.328420  ORF Transcript_131703/g.328420 Transcript_131703/m.328420 type:complete len:330 (-) Transcript_131703:338-1327(-)
MARSRSSAQPRRQQALLATLGIAAVCSGGLTFASLGPGAAVNLSASQVAAQADGTSSALAAGFRFPAVARRGIESSMARSATVDFDLTGKVALVTGASRGIGAAIAERLAKAGATVVGTATSDSGAEAIAARFGGDLKGTGMKLDVVDPDNVAAVLKAIEGEYGGVDILVNNAGITKDTLMMRMKDDAWDAVINTNLNSVFRVTKAVLKGMTKKRWGRIISISSVVGSMGNAGQANYAAAKAGMDGFSRALAREVGSRSITVNSVAPGFIKTDMTDVLKQEWKDKLLESVPAGRLGLPEEIADAVLFLASPNAGYVTGQTLHVNGGMYM